MNNITTNKLSGVIEMLLEDSSRINEAESKKYWYPLSMATYGVEEIIEALDSMCSFRTTMWEKTKIFEEKFAEYHGCKHAIMVNSGSSADLLLSFALADKKQDQEILMPAVTWPTQIWSAIMAGFKVKLVDVDPNTLNIDCGDLIRKITSKTKAIFLVHLMGNPCDMDEILKIKDDFGIDIIEDCCEANGSAYDGKMVGTFGLGGTHSFFFSHHMTTGEGGMIVTNNDEMAEKLRILRAHGWSRNIDVSNYDMPDSIDPRYAFIDWGFNVRPTEMQAGFGIQQMKKLSGFAYNRKFLADMFWTYLKTEPSLSAPVVSQKACPSWLGLPIMVSKDAPFSKTNIMEWLEKNGVETRPIVTGNVARQPVAEQFPDVFDGDFPGADEVHSRGFYIGLSPVQTEDNMEKLIAIFKKFINR